jgi:hypothetical protein
MLVFGYLGRAATGGASERNDRRSFVSSSSSAALTFGAQAETGLRSSSPKARA